MHPSWLQPKPNWPLDQGDGEISGLDRPQQSATALSRLAVEDVWGVGYRWAKKLNAADIETPEDLRRTGPTWIARAFNVVRHGQCAS